MMNSVSLGNGSAEAASRELHFSARQVAELFPFHLVFDSQLRVCQAGASLLKLMPGLGPGSPLPNDWTLETPLIAWEFDPIVSHSGSLFILASKQRKTRLRGQMVPMPASSSIAFLCSPWLPEPGAFRSTGLTFNDFPLHDSMPEFMSVVQSQRLGMEDLRKISEKLRVQREALKDANRKLLDQSVESRKLALIASRTDNGVVVTDAAGRIEWVNEAFEKITGFALDEVRGKSPGSVLQGPATNAATAAYMRAQIAAGQSFTCEIENYDRQGRRYWLAIEAQPIHDESGAVVNFMAMERDITARKEADFRKDLAYSVTTVLAEATHTSLALQKILQIIVEALGCTFSVLWRLNQNTSVLYPARIWSPPELRNSFFETQTRETTITPGVGLPGTVWEQNSPVWLPDLAHAENFLRRDSAARDGLRSAFAFPIRVGGEARGVMEFFSRGCQEPEPELLRTLTALGNQIGQFMERQDAEAERRRLVSLLNSTLESTADGILVTDLARRFVIWNQRFLNIWGVSAQLLTTNPAGGFAHAAKMVTQPEEFSRQIFDWFERSQESGENTIHFRDGRVFRHTTQPQVMENSVIGRVWNFRDITESWRAVEALRESEERYRVISSTASDGIITVNRHNQILFANDAADRMFAYPSGSLPGRSLYELMGSEYRSMDAKPLLRTVRPALAHLRSRSTEVTGLRRDGEEIPLEVSFSRSHIRGNTLFTGVIRDISARRQAAAHLLEAVLEMEVASRAQSDFLASISHEIRTPLNSIAGLTELLRDTYLNSAQREMLDTIWAGSESLLHLINDLLDFSKIEAGQIEVASDAFDPAAICGRCLEIVGGRAKSSGLQLTFTAHPQPVPRLTGDPNRISQILLNLLVNGIKFTEKGSVNLDLNWTREADGLVRADFVVRDTGIGVPARDRGKIFEKFYRADTPAVRRAGGTGLGLSIARLLAERMGGSLSLEETGGSGACFRLSLALPVCRPSPGDVSGILAAGSVKSAAAAGALVLLVEDNPDSQIYATRVFQKAGHAVVVASSVAEVLRLTSDRQFDVIFMDVMLSDGNGFDATREIRAREHAAGREQTPIIALTASALKEYRDRAFKAGMDDFLTKPVRAEALIAAVARWAASPEVVVDASMADLVPDYLERIRASAADLSVLAHQADFTGIQSSGHNLKGSGSAWGVPEITRLGGMIENAGRAQDTAAASSAASELVAYLARVKLRDSAGNRE